MENSFRYGFDLPKLDVSLAATSYDFNSFKPQAAQSNNNALLSGANAFAGVAASVSATYSAYSAYKMQAEYQREISKINVMLSDYASEDALQKGFSEAASSNRQVRELIGVQKAAYASQNVALNFGSARDVVRATNFMGEIDALRIKNNAYPAAFGYTIVGLDA